MTKWRIKHKLNENRKVVLKILEKIQNIWKCKLRKYKIKLIKQFK